MARSPVRQAAAPECAILSNEAALHSLKRAQLLALCKQHGVKGSGKNVDLIARLQERGRYLLEQAGDASMTEENADTSTASWAIVSDVAPAQASESPDFGEQATRALESAVTESSSSSSISSTLRTAGSSLYRAIVSSNPTVSSAAPAPLPFVGASQEAPSARFGIYPSLRSFQTDERQSPTTPAGEDAPLCGIRPVSRPSLMAEQPISSAATGQALPCTSPFVFGSPVKDFPSSAPSSAFTFSMPRALFASTSSTTSVSHEQVQLQLSAAESLLEEMNRRAREAKSAAEAAGSKRSRSFVVGSTSGSGDVATTAATKKAAFDVSHKRTFEKMDSIATHWAAKRKIPSTGDVVGMTRSSSARSLSVPPEGKDGRTAKRQKSGSQVKAHNRNNRDQQVVAALRESGWSDAADRDSTGSLATSFHSGVSTLSRAVGGAKGEPTQNAAEQTRRKRQLELAKARRKSGAAKGAGMSKRRPSLGVGPTPSKSTAARLFRSTVRKLASTAPVPPLPSAVVSGRPTTERPGLVASASQPVVPRFAAPTASTASRAALTAATSPIKSTRLISPLKQSARKAFDLQASLKRPITWQSHLRSPMVQASPSTTRAAAAPATSSVLAKPPMELSREPTQAVRQDGAQDVATEHKLLSLPQAPTSAFTLSRSPGPATSSSAWQPPAITRSPLLPTTPNAERKASTRVTASTKKTISASSRAARSEDKTRARKGVEGVEARARMLRTKAAAAKARNPQ